jgi:hypothetical protein
MTAQLFTLLGVIVGALSSFAVGTYSERIRYRREVSKQWTDRRLESYARYIEDVKYMWVLARRIVASFGLEERAPALSREDGLPLLAEAETKRSYSAEMVTLMSSRETIEALRQVNEKVWRLEWYARGLLGDKDRDDWIRSTREFHEALDNFQECIRRDLGIQGEFVRRDSGSPSETRP